jgi:hypothetical protein
VREENVRRLDVAVNDSLGVRVLECVGDFRRYLERLIDGQRTFGLDPLGNRRTIHEGHHIIWEPIYLARVEDGQDVRVLQRCRDSYLAREALAADDAREVGAQQLERDPVSMSKIACKVDCRHSTTPKLTLDCIAAVDDSGDCQWIEW